MSEEFTTESQGHGEVQDPVSIPVLPPPGWRELEQREVVARGDLCLGISGPSWQPVPRLYEGDLYVRGNAEMIVRRIEQ